VTARKTTPKTVTVATVGKTSVSFTGNDRAVYAIAKNVDARIMRNTRGTAWLIPERDAQDVLAMLERGGFSVQVTL
jgi:hypothetical protein